MKDTNRPDLWSVEGLSRALQGYLKHAKGIKQYSVGKSAIEVNVNASIIQHSPLHLLLNNQRHPSLRQHHQRNHAPTRQTGPNEWSKPTKNLHRHLQLRPN